MNATPLVPSSVQNLRQGPLKRHCLEVSGSPGSSPDLDRQVELLLSDESMPSHLRTVLAWLLEERKQMYSISVLCKELSDEVTKLRSENAELKQRLSDSLSGVSIVSAPDPSTSPKPIVPVISSFEEVERRRSVIVSGVSESLDPVSSSRVMHDYHAVRDIMNFLSIDCSTISLFSLSSFFAKLLLRRAPRLKHYRHSGVFLRPSLPKEERERLRTERLARRNSQAAPTQPTSVVIYVNLMGSDNLLIRTGSSTIDLVLSESLVKSNDVGPPIGTSDHSAIFFHLNLTSCKGHLVSKRMYKNANGAVCEYLSNIDWVGSFNSAATVSDKYELFIFILHHVIQLFVPVARLPLQKTRLPPHLRSLHDRKYIAWQLAVASGSVEDWTSYRRIDAIFARRLRKYNDFIERKVIRSADKGSFYRLMNSRLHSRLRIPVLKSVDGVTARTDEQKAELLAYSFAKAFAPSDTSTAQPCSSSFPAMGDSVWFHADDIHQLLAVWSSSTSDTPDHAPL
ncbi:hypothetical protein OSTOST_03505, partial [Ostertagia ostertagi]